MGGLSQAFLTSREPVQVSTRSYAGGSGRAIQTHHRKADSELRRPDPSRLYF
jgi:hypothetical protein